MCSEEKLTDLYVLGESLGSGTYSVVKKGIRKVSSINVITAALFWRNICSSLFALILLLFLIFGFLCYLFFH